MIKKAQIEASVQTISGSVAVYLERIKQLKDKMREKIDQTNQNREVVKGRLVSLGETNHNINVYLKAILLKGNYAMFAPGGYLTYSIDRILQQKEIIDIAIKKLNDDPDTSEGNKEIIKQAQTTITSAQSFLDTILKLRKLAQTPIKIDDQELKTINGILNMYPEYDNTSVQRFLSNIDVHKMLNTRITCENIDTYNQSDSILKCDSIDRTNNISKLAYLIDYFGRFEPSVKMGQLYILKDNLNTLIASYNKKINDLKSRSFTFSGRRKDMEENVKKYNCVIILTDHDNFNYKNLLNANIIIDTRGKFKKILHKNIYHL
jgi:hypothetical protein